MRPGSRLSRDCPLMKQLLADLHSVLPSKKGEPLRLSTPQESYAHEVFGRTAYLLEALDSLYEAVFYVKHFPSSKTYRDKGPTRPYWYRYHIENFYIRLKGISDRAVSLLGSIVLTDDKERPTFKKVMNHELVKDHSVSQCLYRLGTIVQQSKSLRDGLVHEYTYVDDELRVLALLTMAVEEKWDVADTSVGYLQWNTRFYVLDTVNKLKGIVSAVESECEELLTHGLALYTALSPGVRWKTTDRPLGEG